MLSRSGVEQRLRAGQVRISYFFDPSAAGGPAQLTQSAPVDPDQPGSLGTQIFLRNFFAQRLGLTVGPLVLSHQYDWHRKRKRYKGIPGVFDLRLSGGNIALLPGESVTVNSIEHVTLGSNTGAITYPRLSHATAGLVLSTSYIDPYWDGILVLHLTNTARRPILLRFGEKFASTMFYDIVEGPVEPETRDKFVQKSHHYGLSWERILSSDADPFPLRKQPVPGLIRGNDSSARELVGRYGKPLATAGVTVAVVVSALVYIGRLQQSLGDVKDLQQRQQAQEAEVKSNARDIADIKSSQVQSGSVIVSIQGGAREGRLDFPVPGAGSKAAQRVVLVSPIGPANDITAQATLTPGPDPNSVLVRLVVRRPVASGSDIQVVVRYILV